MPILDDLKEAVSAVQKHSPLRPTVGLVLGSGLGAFAQTLERAVHIPYGQIPHFPTSTAIGHKGDLAIGHSQGVPIAVMCGRVHHYEGYTAAQVVFPIRVLGQMGIKILIMTNAAGSVNVNFKPGELMIIEDHINYMGINPMIGPNEDKLGDRFFDLSEAYDVKLREIAEKACRAVAMPVRKGVYIAFSGPSYETPAEIKMARTLGADAVGMSTVPECLAANHCGLKVAALSLITNLAAGLSGGVLTHEETLAEGAKAYAGIEKLLLTFFSGLDG